MSSDILQGLNPAQREAVVNFESPSLIIAGAGSGKTRVLTSRIAYMISQGVKPYNILALTFTNKAASEMRERITAMVGNGSQYIRMGTFHSVFSRILRENAGLIGYPDSYTIYEPNDSKNIIKTILKEMSLPEDNYKPAAVLSRISMAKNSLVTAGAYLASAALVGEDRQRKMPELANVYAEYCRRCKLNGAMDFDDLLLQTNILLRDHPEVAARYQDLFQYILVDEYQDTNIAQYIIIRKLADKHHRICVVGDDAQSIYSFRGAKIENILSFQRDYPEANTFRLEQNYRSTQTIVNAANSVIEHNKRRMKKTCFSQGETGEKIRIMRAFTDREEAEIVSSDIRRQIRNSSDAWSEVAVLYRNNAQSKAVEDSLRKKGIPYKIYKGNSFYDHKEIKDFLAYIRLITNPHDDEAFKRIINEPARGIGNTTITRIEEIAKQRGESMWTTLEQLSALQNLDSTQKAVLSKAGKFLELIRNISLLREQTDLYNFGLEVATRSGLLGHYRLQNTPEATSAIDNLEEALNTMQEFSERVAAEIRSGEREQNETATVEEWMQEVMLSSDQDKDNDEQSKNKVTLMTVHSAKGLEYKYVYIVGCEQGLFPSDRALEAIENLEEERRLFYVALTRAKTQATLTFAETRFKWGSMDFSRPSMFLQEIDSQYVDCDVPLSAKPAPADNDEKKPSAIEELRNRYDFRNNTQKRDFSRPSGTSQFSDKTRRAETSGMRRLSPVQSSKPAFNATPAGEFRIGDRVSHQMFGHGTITNIETVSADTKLTINFDNKGQKALIARFAKLTKL